MIEDRNTLILYSTAVCNLKCKYCFIDKNPALVKIDKILDESFQGDYYFNFAKKVFPDPEQLTEVQLWGGEPTLNFHRVVPTLQKLFGYYPNLNKIMFSTNLAHDKSVDEIFYLIKSLKEYQNYNLRLQLSIDGPTYINDLNRGTGTTEKFSRNFIRLVSEIDDLLEECQNVTIQAFNKATLDITGIESLQTKEKIINYYKFFEIYQEKSEVSENSRFNFNVGVPNTACPLPVTTELGYKFANLCKLSREIEEENKTEHYFNHFVDITPFSGGHRCCSGYCNTGACGSGKYCIGLLPNDLISTCHNGFTEILGEYKKYANENKDRVSTLQDIFFSDLFVNDMVFPYEGLAKYEVQVEHLYNQEEKNQLTALVGQIQLLALNKQIDSKYKNVSEAISGALFLLNHASYCIRDNLNTTGTKILNPPNLIKLLLNGAKEFIEAKQED